MQFIFGDNTSKYTLLFHDDSAENAAKIMDLVRLRYSANPTFDSYGFIPFGVNSNRALFVKFQKDRKMVRNVYMLHGVYSDINPEYFFTDAYLTGIFTNFVDQEQFDAIRDGMLAGQKQFTVPYSYDERLAQVSEDNIPLAQEALLEVVAKLYQRIPVVIVMDDEKFSNDTVRLLIKKIFGYLTPSLRKISSYITAVDDVSNMDFMLRIIPRSMKRGNMEAVDLDAEPCAYKDRSVFPEVAQYLLKMSAAQRADLFEEFEQLHYGRESIYRKQNFERFYYGYSGHWTDEKTLACCEEILTDYLDNEKCPQLPVIPEFVGRVLEQKYRSFEQLDNLVDWHITPFDDFDKFCNTNSDVIKKVYYLFDQQLTYFATKLNNKYMGTFCTEDVPVLQGIAARMKNVICNEDKLVDAEKALLQAIRPSYVRIQEICDQYVEATERAQNNAKAILERQHKIVAGSDSRLVIDESLKAVGALIYELEKALPDIGAYLERILLNGVLTDHNAKFKRDQAEAQKSRTLKRLVAWLREEENGFSRTTVEKEASFADFLEDCAANVPPTKAEIDQVLQDATLWENVARALVRYIVQVCEKRGDADFVDINEKLAWTSNDDVVRIVAQKLCDSQHADLAVLYTLAYSVTLEAGIRILDGVVLDQMSVQHVATVKKSISQLLQKRRESGTLSEHETRRAIHAVRMLLESCECKRKCAIYKAFEAALLGKKNLLGDKQIVIFAGVACILVGVAVVLLVLLLGGNKDAGQGGTTAPSGWETTAPTIPTTAPSEPGEGTDTPEPSEPGEGTDTPESGEAGEGTDTPESGEAGEGTDTPESSEPG